jgi:hypothetical protein
LRVMRDTSVQCGRGLDHRCRADASHHAGRARVRPVEDFHLLLAFPSSISARLNTLLGPSLGCIDFAIEPQRFKQVIANRDLRRALVSALDDQALHFDAIMALEAARPLVRAPRSQPSIDWARARLMELVCRGLTNKEIRPRVVHQSKHHEEARARRPPETRTRAPSTGVLSRV